MLEENSSHASVGADAAKNAAAITLAAAQPEGVCRTAAV
jgi:hypothetical protein